MPDSKRTIWVTLLPLLIGLIALQNLYAGGQQAITLKLVNGKTGHAVWWLGKAAVRLGDARKSPNEGWLPITTNLLGQSEIDVSKANPAQIEVVVDYISRDCRYSSPSQPQVVVYSIDDIRAKGVVSENHCGGPAQAPRPGVLVIYVIPMSLRELWHL